MAQVSRQGPEKRLGSLRRALPTERRSTCLCNDDRRPMSFRSSYGKNIFLLAPVQILGICGGISSFLTLHSPFFCGWPFLGYDSIS